MRKATLLIVFGMLCCTFAFSQSSQQFSLRGVLRDSLNKEPITGATVLITNAAGTANLGYATTAVDGSFEVKRLPAGKHLLQISMMGYTTFKRTIEMSGSPSVINLGDIALLEDMVHLNEVVVTSIGNPIVVKKDTIEYNASSFKVPEGAMLEDLLKKFPGAEIGSDGSITINGKTVSKVLLDGKTFFSDDPQIATKNLTAKMIDKVQVVDRKSEQSRFTGIDDGNEETVLNLTVLPGMKNGWFGNASAGAGTEERYQGGAFVANLKDDRQISILVSGNNTNNRAFSDISGNMMSQGRGFAGGGGGRMGGGGGFGGMAGGGMRVNIGGTSMNFGGNGITTSWLAGLNYHDEFGKKVKLGGNYFYNGSETDKKQESYRQNLLVGDSTSFYNQFSNSVTNTQGHRVALELEYTISDRTSLLFRPNVNYGIGNFDEQSYYETLTSTGDSVNMGRSSATGDNQSISTNGELLFRHKFNKENRTFSTNVTYGYSDNAIDGKNESYTKIFNSMRPDELVNQQYHSDNGSWSLGTRFSYTEPLWKNHYMELAYNIRYNENTSEKSTYNYNATTQRYDVFDTLYSNHYRNVFVNQQAELNVRGIYEKTSWTVGVNVQPSYTKSEGRDQEAFSRHVVNFSPMAQFSYQPSNNVNLRLNYRGTTNQPSISQLQPVPDNSNPLQERLGNPDLNPSFTQNLMLMYRNTNMSNFRTMVAMVNAAMTSDQIVNMNIYESSTGKQLIRPTNINGSYSATGMFMINSPIKKSKFSVMSNTWTTYNQSVSLSKTVAVFDKDNIDFGNTEDSKTRSLSITEMLRLGYKGNKIDINLSGRAGYSQTWYTLSAQEQPAYWNNSVSGDFTWTLPWDFSLSSDASYTYYIGYSDGYNEPLTMWNAGLSKLLFKKKQGTLAIKVYDILNEQRSNARVTTENYIEDSIVNTLGRYVMFSFTFRFGTFGNSGGGGGRMMGPGGGGFGRPWGGGGNPQIMVM